MSRELFRELLSAEGPSAVSAFQAFMHTSVALGERRAGVVSTMSRAATWTRWSSLPSSPRRRSRSRRRALTWAVENLGVAQLVLEVHHDALA